MSKHSSHIGTKATSSSSAPTIFLALEIRQIPILSPWLDAQSLSLLDIALSSNSARKSWLLILKSITFNAIDQWHHSHSSMKWAIKRNICATQILVSADHSDEVSDLTFEALGIHSNPTLCGEKEKGDSILATWEKRKYLQTIDLSSCEGITDIGISALCHGCDQLLTIHLSRCQGITDTGLLALGYGCSKLQTINLEGCQGITDMGISALGHGCGQLQTINLSWCQGITDMGISALRVRYPSIDIHQ